jgi:hypothetical protein
LMPVTPIGHAMEIILALAARTACTTIMWSIPATARKAIC